MNAPDDLASAAVETSMGDTRLSFWEVAVLSRLQQGEASMEEALAFYNSVSGREGRFPLEWEALVLRPTLRASPGRDDLLARLAVVEEELSRRAGATDEARLGFERLWARFAAGSPPRAGEEASATALRLDDACGLLSERGFGRLTPERQAQIILAIHDSLMAAPEPGLCVAAELGLRRLRSLLADDALTPAQGCAIFDALHSLYFAGVSDVRDLRRFDHIVPSFERWLRTWATPADAGPLPAPDEPLTIAYLLHTAHFERGNAVSQLVASLARMHADRAGRRVILYAVQYVGEAFAAEIEAFGLTVRTFAQGRAHERLDEIAASLRADGVDVVITEQNRALAAALFVRRVAPLQIWLDTGFPFWSLSALDWTISPSASAPDPIRRVSPIRLRQLAGTLKGTVDAGASEAVRSQFPPGAFILGVFARLVKLDAAYLDVLERVLAAEPRFHLLLAGPGETADVERFLERPGVAGRAIFVPGQVDLNVYGPAIDLMLDTFPFIGGNACREVAVHGTPVLARRGTPWDGLLERDRLPALLAEDDDDFIARAVRMANDAPFREEQRRDTALMMTDILDPIAMIEDVEAAIAACRSWKAGSTK